LSGVEELIGNMDIKLSYDSAVLEATEVIKGSLTGSSIFDYNILDGTILIGLADNQGFSGDGSVAYVRFNIIGDEGETSPLSIVDLTANRASDLASMNIETVDGIFTLPSFEETIADCDGDGEISVVDALCALQMAVGKKAEDLAMDVSGDGKVTSLDARQILKTVVGQQASSDIDVAPQPIGAELDGLEDLPGKSSVSLEAGEGGTITTTTGISLEVLPGALLRNATVTVIPVSTSNLGDYAITGIRFEPDGMQLLKPGIVRLPLPIDWDGEDDVEIYEGNGTDPADAWPTGRYARVTGTPGAYIGEVEVYHFSTLVIAGTCHQGTVQTIFNELRKRGCDIDKVVERVNETYPGVDLRADSSPGKKGSRLPLLALLDTYFDVDPTRGILGKDSPLDAAYLSRLKELVIDEGRLVAVLFSASHQWQQKSRKEDYFWGDVAHSAVVIRDNLVSIDPKVVMRNTFRTSTNAQRSSLESTYKKLFGTSEIFYYYDFEKFNEFRTLKHAVPLERFLDSADGSFSTGENKYGFSWAQPMEATTFEDYMDEEVRLAKSEMSAWEKLFFTKAKEQEFRDQFKKNSPNWKPPEPRPVAYPSAIIYVERDEGSGPLLKDDCKRDEPMIDLSKINRAYFSFHYYDYKLERSWGDTDIIDKDDISWEFVGKFTGDVFKGQIDLGKAKGGSWSGILKLEVGVSHGRADIAYFEFQSEDAVMNGTPWETRIFGNDILYQSYYKSDMYQSDTWEEWQYRSEGSGALTDFKTVMDVFGGTITVQERDASRDNVFMALKHVVE
jgi:hypothetical protein